MLVCLVLMVATEGCASFRAGSLPSVSLWPPPAANGSKSIIVVVAGKTIVNGSEREFVSPFLDQCLERTVAAYRESRLFSQVNARVPEPDLRADVNIIDRMVVPVWLDILAVLTFALSPTTHMDTFVMTTTLTNQAGRLLGTFHKSEVIATTYHLLLIVGSLTHRPDQVTKETIYDLNRTILLEAHAQRLL